MRFSNSKKNKSISKKVFASIESNLATIDEEMASEYLSWIDKQTLYFKKSINKEGYKAQPDNLSRGDIVWVEFGINIGTELSDYKTKGHYAVAWIIDLGNVVVIPLSSREPTSSELTFDLGVIDGLNEKDGIHSYLKLDAIRSVSKRRIGRIIGKENGKLTLSNDTIELIKKIIQKTFAT